MIRIPVDATGIELDGRVVPAARAPAGGHAEGSLAGPARWGLIAPPHPLYGGTFGNPVVRALEASLRQAGYATLAFNFRGTGESGGEPSGALSDALADYLAAAHAAAFFEAGHAPAPARPPSREGNAPAQASLRARTGALFAGYSFGSVAALAAAIELGVPRVLLVAPPLALLDAAELARYAGRIAVVAASQDEYAPAAGLRDRLGAHPDGALEVIDDADHFFLGSAVQRLSAGLAKLLRAELGPR